MTTLESNILAVVRSVTRITFGEICAALPDVPQTIIISTIVMLKGYGLMEGHADGYKAVMAEVTS